MSELDDIRANYDAGRLEGLRGDLERFLVAHREKIRVFAAEQAARGLQVPQDAAVKFYILRLRSINPRREIQDQLEEIQREKWIRGINTGCAPDPQEVATDWAKRYSAMWREHRLTEIVYVFEREKDRYLKILES
ncbi:MAG TPA: hypothetical protein VF950_00760 [Planctomycetota bacterium]